MFFTLKEHNDQENGIYNYLSLTDGEVNNSNITLIVREDTKNNWLLQLDIFNNNETTTYRIYSKYYVCIYEYYLRFKNVFKDKNINEVLTYIKSNNKIFD